MNIFKNIFSQSSLQDDEPPSEAHLAFQKKLNTFQTKIAQNIMTPRTEMVTVESSTALTSALKLINQKGFSRIPVQENNNDNIVGILYAKDLLKNIDSIPKEKVSSLMREPQFISFSLPIQNLLDYFRNNRIHIAMVIDEFGGVDGLVTMEDIIEELCGEIQDEYDITKEPKVVYSGKMLIIDSSYSVMEFNELFHAQFDLSHAETIGGFICNHLGKIPTVGEEIIIDDIHFKILKANTRRVLKISVEKKLKTLS